MEFNKELFFDYLKEEKKLNNKFGYLYKLYKTFDITESILSQHPNSGRKLLEKYEDSIYTVNGNILSDNKRINNEIQNISNRIMHNEINDKSVYDDISKLINDLKDLDVNDSSIVFYIKKQLSVLQAKLGMQNTFFLAAHDVFLEIYRKIYMSQNDEADFDKEYIKSVINSGVEDLKNKR